MPKIMPEERWNMPDDEHCDWSNAAASDTSAAKHVQQTKKSWVLTTPPRSIDTSKKQGNSLKQKEPAQVSPLAASRLAPFLKKSSAQTTTSTTPATFASTPDTFTSPAPDEPLPESYVTMIANAFGHKADLYRDVLGISRNATPRAVRIAYFKRGRQVLSQGSPRSMKASRTVGGQINETARLRFQAVSMAYEIISNPTWLDAYERCMLITDDESEDEQGVLNEDDVVVMSPPSSVMSPPTSTTDTAQVLSDPDVSMSSTRSLASTSALRRRSRSADGRRISSSKSYTGGVRWNEEVEELVFNQDPEERKPKKKKKRSKKKKKRITVDEGVDLQKHLEQLDKEAEKNFVHDFLDDLEQSIDQLLSFGADDDSDEEDNEQQELGNPSRRLFPEMETELVPEELSTPKQPKKKRQVPGAPKKKRSSRKLETSDIDDEEFGIYKRHRQRSLGRPNTNPFDDDRAPTESDSRHEVARGSHPVDLTPREGSAIENDGDDEESYVSFPELESRERNKSHDASPPLSPRSKGESTHFHSKTPLSPKASRGESAWEPSPHSPSRNHPHSPKRSNGTDASSSRTPNSSLRTSRGRQALPDHPSSPRSPKSSSSRKSARSKERKKYFEAPNDIAVTKRYEKSFDDDSAVYTVADSVSTLSASVVQRHINRDLTNSRYKEGIEQDRQQQQMERLQEGDDALNVSNSVVDNGINAGNANTRDIVVPIKPPAKTLESVQEVSRETSREVSRDTSKVDPGVNTSVEVSLNTSGNDLDASDAFCFHLCGDDLAETARAAGIAQGDPDDPSFTAFLMVYLNAMAADLARLGHSIQANLPTFDFEITDKDLGGMLNILETEMEEVPDDIAKTLSQEFLPKDDEEETFQTTRDDYVKEKGQASF